MKLVHVKLKHGEDLIGHLISTYTANTEIYTPIALAIDPTTGIFAKSWLLFSEANSVRIQSSDYLFYSDASQKAIQYYDEFMHQVADERPTPTSDEVDKDLDMFVALMESKSSIKH